MRAQTKIAFFLILALIPIVITLFLVPGKKEEKGVNRRYICNCQALGEERKVIVDIKIPSLSETGQFTFPININLSIEGQSVPCACEPVSIS